MIFTPFLYFFAAASNECFGHWGKPTIPASAQLAIELPHAVSILIIPPWKHRHAEGEIPNFDFFLNSFTQYNKWYSLLYCALSARERSGAIDKIYDVIAQTIQRLQ